MRDLNDILREEGAEAVLRTFDRAKVMNGYTRPEIEHAIRTLPKGWMNAGSAPINPDAEYWEGTLGRGTGMIVGPSSAGKTTITCGLGHALATGSSFFGRRIIEPMGVAHILGEAVSGVARRYKAIGLHTGTNEPLPIAWKQNTSDLFDQKVRRTLIAELRELSAYQRSEFDVSLRVLFFDTATTNWFFKDENDNPSWVKLTQHLQEFADAIDGLAMTTHHPPKTGVGERGGGAGRAGVDYIIATPCDRNDETGEVKNRQLALTKHRDGETGIISALELKTVALGIIDTFGKEITSVVAIPSDMPVTVTTAKSKDTALTVFHRAFNEALHTHGREHEAFSSADCQSPVVMAVPLDAIRDEFFRRWCVDQEDEMKAYEARKRAFNRVLQATLDVYGRENIDGAQLLWKLSA